MYKWNPFTNNLDEKGDWLFGGNILGAKKTLGSIDNQDFGIITNNIERLTINKDGRIGVGTTTTTGGLFTIKQATDTANDGFRLYNSDGTKSFYFYINPVADGGNPRFGSNSGMVFEAQQYLYLRGTLGTVIADGSSGNVQIATGTARIGLGTGSPARKVHIQNDTDAALYIRRNSTTDGHYSEILQAVSTADIYHTAIRTYRDGRLGFFTNNVVGAAYADLTESMTILKDGKVGIGTTNPSNILTVAKLNNANDSTIKITSDGATDEILHFTNETVSRTWSIGRRNTANTFEIAYNANTTGGIRSGNIMSILNTGYIGIGTTNPTNKLDVRGTSATDGIRSAIGFDIYPVPNPTTLSGVAVAGAGLEIGDYYYLITYTTALGETNSFLANKVTTTAGNQSVTLTIPVSTDPRVTRRRIYRSKVNTAGYLDYILVQIANNTDTTYTDTTPDASLAGSVGASYFRMNTTSNQITVGGVRSMIIDTNNTAFGYLAGGSITIGGRSTLFGYGAGRLITTGSSCAYFGDRAGWNTTTGAHNVAINYQSLFNNTTGSYNTGIGTNSLLNNATGSNDIAIGFYTLAGVSGNSHSNNVSVGNYSGYLITTGQYNTFLSHQAGYNISTGSYNLYAGYNAGRFIADGTTANQTSNYGVYLGNGTKASANGVDNEIAIGYNAIGKGANTVTIGNTSILANYFSGQLIPGKISSAPTAIEGGIYFNSTDKHFYGYNGTDWKQLDN